MAAEHKSITRGSIGPITIPKSRQIRHSGNTGATHRFFRTHMSQCALDSYLPQTTSIKSKNHQIRDPNQLQSINKQLGQP